MHVSVCMRVQVCVCVLVKGDLSNSKLEQSSAWDAAGY